MEYVEIIKNGTLVQIIDGEVTKVIATKYCDSCNSEQDPTAGISVHDVDSRVILWICSKCRNI